MKLSHDEKLISLLYDIAEPLSASASQFDSLLEKIGNSRFVLIGESTHGTHEFYETRAEITRQLIIQKGFMAVAIEANWPDAYQANCYLKGKGDRKEAEKSLYKFKHFPTWMWRNTTLPPFLQWLRDYNDSLSKNTLKIGFYGLGIYSLSASMSAVINYLNQVAQFLNDIDQIKNFSLMNKKLGELYAKIFPQQDEGIRGE